MGSMENLSHLNFYEENFQSRQCLLFVPKFDKSNLNFLNHNVYKKISKFVLIFHIENKKKIKEQIQIHQLLFYGLILNNIDASHTSFVLYVT